MFNRRYLIISLVFPLLVTVGLIIAGVVFAPVARWAVLGLYGEHLLIALALGTDLEKHTSSGGFLALPLVPWAAVATLIVDYLLLAVIAYVFLLIKAKISRTPVSRS